MFIFARCLRSSAAVTPAKYELDIIKVTTVLIIQKKMENNGTEKIGLVTPTPGGKATLTHHIRQGWGGGHNPGPPGSELVLHKSFVPLPSGSYRRQHLIKTTPNHDCHLFLHRQSTAAPITRENVILTHLPGGGCGAMVLAVISEYIYIYILKFNLCGQQHLYSTHEGMFLWKLLRQKMSRPKGDSNPQPIYIYIYTYIHIYIYIYIYMDEP